MSIPLWSQDGASADSLREVIHTGPTDSARFDALLALAEHHLYTAPDSSYTLCVRAEKLADRTGRPADAVVVNGWIAYLEEQRGDIAAAVQRYERTLLITARLDRKKDEAIILNNLAAIYKDQGAIDRALRTHQRSLALSRDLQDSARIGTSLNNIGLLLYDQGRIPEAMEHYSQALRLFEAQDDPSGIATALHNIASVYKDQGDLNEALRTFQQALLLSTRIADQYGMAGTEDNIGGVLDAQGRPLEALTHFKRAYELHAAVEDQRGMGYSLRNIARIEFARDRLDEALAQALRSKTLFEQADDKRGLATAHLMIAQVLDARGDRTLALENGERALVLGRELGFPTVQRDAAALLSGLYRRSRQWEKALSMQDHHFAMRDSLGSIEARRSALRQQYQYAYEKKEEQLRQEQIRKDLRAQAELQAERSRRNIVLLIGLGVLAFAAGLWSRLRFVRRSRAVIQRERDRSDELLLNILPAEVALELRSKGTADAVQIEQVTVLFTDFKGFTAMSEQVTPRQLVHDLHECFSAFDRIAEKYGIEKIKTIGDAYMAAGGLPTPNATHATDVISAALEMRDFIADGKTRKIAAGLPYFEIRIGIHTGPVVAGIVGVKKFQYDIWGDTVNIASRMESSGEVGQVNISAATYSIVKGEPGFTFKPRGKVQAKGKGEMEMYFVQADRAPQG